MSETIEGVYRNGRVELQRQPRERAENSRVLVTFMSTPLAHGPERDALIAEMFADMRKPRHLGGSYLKREEMYEQIMEERRHRNDR